MANIGMPKVSITFSGLGSSAVQRGSRGIACIVIKDDTDKTFEFAEYKSIDELTSTEVAKYTTTNLTYINDVLLGGVNKVIVARMDTDGTLADTLATLKTKSFDWVGLCEGETADHLALVTWVKAINASDNKKYKAVVYKTVADHDHIVNFTNTDVTFADTRGKVSGDKFVARLVGMLAGMPLNRSAISYTFTDLVAVSEPEDLEASVNAGEFVLFNDEGDIKVARGVNSLTTIGEGVTDDFKYIMIIESQDLIYKDIMNTWKKFYKGVYKNSSDNQFLLISAINTYFDQLEISGLLDAKYNNVASIDVVQQRLANTSKYGEDEVATWDDAKVINMTVGTQVYLKANIKILNAMEDMALVVTL